MHVFPANKLQMLISQGHEAIQYFKNLITTELLHSFASYAHTFYTAILNRDWGIAATHTFILLGFSVVLFRLLKPHLKRIVSIYRLLFGK